MTVYETIEKLIRVQGYASLSSISKCSGIAMRDVLTVLDVNSGLLTRKGSRIVAVRHEDVHAAIANARASGKIFWRDGINYGAETALEWAKGRNPEADKLRSGYCCGGLGDNYTVQVLLDRPENRMKLLDLGMSEQINPKDWLGYLEWQE